MSSRKTINLSTTNSPGHLFQIGQRVRRRQTGSAHMLFGSPRLGTIVGLTWTPNRKGASYPTYAVKFDNSGVVDSRVQQMRLILLD
jgi:hypothetical protein